MSAETLVDAERLLPSLQEAKRIVTIPVAWKLLGLRPVLMNFASARSPFRLDTNPSFSVFEGEDGTSLFKDHGTGDCGDVVHFVEQCLRSSRGEAMRWVRLVAYVLLLPEGDSVREEMRVHLGLSEVRPVPNTSVSRPVSSAGLRDNFRSVTEEEMQAIADVRGFGQLAGLWLAVERGMLMACATNDGPAWVMTDARRLHASRRLISGCPFEGGMKAKTVAGSSAGWPIGLADAKDRSHIVICEGGPDTLAALTLLAETSIARTHVGEVSEHGVVMMGGASCNFILEALELMRGKPVTIVPHRDDAGATAQVRWAEQLRSVGSTVRVFDLTPYLSDDGKDLNDALRPDSGSLAANLFLSRS